MRGGKYRRRVPLPDVLTEVGGREIMAYESTTPRKDEAENSLPHDQ